MIKTPPKSHFIERAIAFGVMAHGFLLVMHSAVQELLSRPHSLGTLLFDSQILIGLTLIYLSTLLARGKRNAWLVTIIVYGFNLLTTFGLAVVLHHSHFKLLHGLQYGLTTLLIGLLIYYRRYYRVRSDIRSFGLAARNASLLLLAALLYGIIGFQLLDSRDFHREISLGQSFHYTVDQFDLTSDKPLVAYTRRGERFLESLSLTSLVALGYVGLAFFAPLKNRFGDQGTARSKVRRLLEAYGGSSEDFFKLWPEDKVYFFMEDSAAAIAYRVQGGVALGVGDPVGNPHQFPELLDSFLERCRVNDWLPSFIHTEDRNAQLYKSRGFNMQKIGQEAIVDLGHFQSQVRTDTYFRQLVTKLSKKGYYYELLKPPHSAGIISQLKQVNEAWLGRSGRVERGFLMGYFSETYLEQCSLMVVRSDDHTMQAFINQIPSFNKTEANYDLLRAKPEAAANTNDFLLIHFIEYVQSAGFEQLNLGLCPLAGLDVDTDQKGVINSALGFVYDNGNRFYSFSGLKRFKAKYQPLWSNRFIAYQGGLVGFTRTLRALNKTMKVK